MFGVVPILENFARYYATLGSEGNFLKRTARPQDGPICQISSKSAKPYRLRIGVWKKIADKPLYILHTHIHRDRQTQNKLELSSSASQYLQYVILTLRQS